MADRNWGNCKNCRYFNSSNLQPDAGEKAQCTQPHLAQFALSVSGDSGCNLHEARTGVSVEEQAPTMH